MNIYVGNTSITQRAAKISKPKKLRSTRLFITIAPNFHPVSDEESAQRCEDFRQTLSGLFDDSNMDNILSFGRYKAECRGDTYANNVKTRNTAIGVELGEIKKNIHAHILLEMEHDSNVQLNISRVSSYVKNEMNKKASARAQREFFKTKQMYVQVKLMAQKWTPEEVMEYITKTMIK
jgi:hypothetical protein